MVEDVRLALNAKCRWSSTPGRGNVPSVAELQHQVLTRLAVRSETTKMADENVISVLDPEVKSEVSNNGYELVHSKSPLFYDCTSANRS